MFQAIFTIFLVLLFIAMLGWTILTVNTNLNKKRKRDKALAMSKVKKEEDEDTEEIEYFWFNKDDMEEATDPVMQLRCKHFFQDKEECVHDLVTEMYDCGIVKTEELFVIAYGKEALTSDSLIFKLNGVNDQGDAIDDDDYYKTLNSLPKVSSAVKEQIYQKWESYVTELMDIVDLEASEEMIKDIMDGLLVYGHKNLRDLLHNQD